MKLVFAFMLAVLATGAAAIPRAPVPATELPGRSWTPDGPTRAHIVGLHNFRDYHTAFARLGPGFARRGIAVHAFDQRGLGRTANNGHGSGTDRMVAVAMPAAVREPELIDARIRGA